MKASLRARQVGRAAAFLFLAGCATGAASGGGSSATLSCDGKSLLAGACTTSDDCCQGGCAGGECKCVSGEGACTHDEACCSHACVEGACAICTPRGNACSSDGDCCSSSCVNGVCDASGVDEQCTATKDCKDELVCSVHICRVATGGACTEGPDCSSNRCDNGICACQDGGENCTVDADCCDGRKCNNKGKGTLTGMCFRGKGEACNPKTVNDCASQTCTNGTCACSKYFCVADTDCCSGSCVGGTCKKDPGGCADGGGENTADVSLSYSDVATPEKRCGCISSAGCDGTYFATTKQATLRYTTGDAFHPTVITVSLGGGNDVDVAVNETSSNIPSVKQGFYQNQHATSQVTFTKQDLRSGGTVEGTFNNVVLDAQSGGGTVTLSGSFHSILK